MVDIVTRAGKGSPLTNNEVDANFTNLAEVSGVTGEPMGHEDRTTSTISFNASTRTFTIAPVSGSFTVWCKGKKVVVSSAQTVTIPNTSGMHSIYYDANGTLSSKIGYFTFSTEAPTAYVYWNATTGAAPYFGDERHGVVLDWQTHEYLHRTRGAAIANGFLASGYTLNNSSTNAATQIAIESGTFFDEDMKIDIVSTATPTAGTYQQNLLFPAKIPVLHLQGTSWVMDAPTDFPFKQGTSRPQYNSVSGGVWSTADVGNNQHATTWILATNNLTYPVIAIIGQSATDNLGEAEAFSFADLTLTGFPSVEFRPLYKLIYKASDGYANSVNAQLVSIVDLRSISAVGSVANPATDHGNLSGLSDDDHPQYLSVDTVRGTLTAAVKASFLPSQAGNAGKFLTTDATSTSWASLTSGNITTALGFTPYNATNPAGYITGITSSNVTTALGFTPYNATNPSGFVTAAGARGAISVTGAGSYDSATGVINIVGGVTSFNTRTGAITLSSADVTTALGFTPYNNTNPNNFLTGITSTQVTTALGYTPYNSSNPSGYITGITSGMVTTALGFTPYNNSNPSGYITNSALSGYLTSASAASTYLPLSGGTLSGILTANGGIYATKIGIASSNLADQVNGAPWYGLGFSDLNFGAAQVPQFAGYYGIRIRTASTIMDFAPNGDPGNINVSGGGFKVAGNTVLHAGNYNSYSPTLTGGGASGTWNISISGNAATVGSLAINTSGRNDQVNQIVRTDANGYIQAGWINTTSGDNGTSAIDRVYASNDGYIRYYTPANFRTVLDVPTRSGSGASGTWGISITGNSATTTVMRSFYAGDVGNLASADTGIIYNYNTVGAWTGAPSGMSYGSVYHLGGSGGGGVLSLQLAADINHNSTSSTKQLWFRTSNNLGFQNDWKEVIHSGNYSSYVSSSAVQHINGDSGTFNLNVSGQQSFVRFSTGVWVNTPVPGNYSHVLSFNAASDNRTFQFYLGDIPGTLYYRPNQGGTWHPWERVLSSNNYNSYSPTLTGGGASGTWGINVTGTAGSISGYNNPTTSASANTIVYRDGNAHITGNYILGSYFNSSAGNSENPTIGQVWTQSTGDNYLRKSTPAHFISQLGLITTSNYSSYALPLSGGTLSGGLTVNNAVINAPQGFVSNGNPWGTSNSAFFPNGITTNNVTNWIYGYCYLGNAPSNGSGAEVQANGRFHNSVSSGTAMHVRRTGSAGNATNSYTALFEQTWGDHSWGIVAEFRAGGSGGSDRPSILFSNGYNSTTWSVGFGAADDQFRINQNHGHRNGGWGSERFRIDTGGTAYFNGNVALHAANINSYIPSWSTGVTGNHIVQRDGNGYIYANHVNFNTGIENPTIDNFITGNGDGWSRKSSLAHVKNSIRGIADGTWGINVTGNAESATRLINLRTINGSGFDGTSNIDATEWFHSGRDFPSGTLITTNINYAVTYGDPFVLEIRGNSYGNIIPLDLQYQGYIYSDTIINHGGLSNGLMIQGLVAINNGGNLCFWFPSQGYWNGYNVKVYTAYATRAVNRVTSITGTGKPTTAKEVALTANIRQSLHSDNFGNYALPLSGGTVTGTLNTSGRFYANNGIQISGAFILAPSGATYDNSTGMRMTENYGALWNGSNSATWHHQIINGSSLVGFQASGGNFGNGNILASGNVTAYYSDERLKTKITTIQNALDKVRSLEGFIYVENELAKSVGYTNSGEQAGVSAQRVKAVLPQAVSLAPFDMQGVPETGEVVSKSGENYLTVDYSRLSPLLIEAIKEQDQEIVDLRNRVAHLESLINRLIGD